MSKSSNLASKLIAATGICCLRSSVLPGHPGHSRVAIGGIADRGSKGHRIWFQSPIQAEKILAELFRNNGTRRGDTLVIEVAPDEADRLLRASARLLGICVIEDAEIDALLASLTARTETAIVAMGRQGTLKRLRRITEFDLTGLLERQSV